ncbi:MAG: hypothetical protein ACRD2E_02535 [Terriglobales bacterium]
MAVLYHIVLYACTAAVVGLIAYRWLHPRPALGAARVVNEVIWTAIPAAVLIWLLLR